MVQTAHTSTLTAAYENQKRNFCNRSSAVFPLKLSARSDLRLSFLNYWLLKNKIEPVQMNLRAYDAAGKKIFQSTTPVGGMHHDVSMRALLGTGVEGMVEIEFISLQNLVFAFPAVCGFFEGDGGVSAVHSAGRVRNADEPFRDTLTEETNWTCKYGDGIAPFVHVFNGPRTWPEHTVIARIYGEENQIVAEKRLDRLVGAPFSSRIVHFDEVFRPSELAAMAFASVTLHSNEIFPRLIVGNYHRSRDFLEATHTYPNTASSNDYVEPPPEPGRDLLMYMPLPQPPELETQCILAPTHAAPFATATVRATREAGAPLAPTGRTVQFGGEGPRRVLRLRPEPHERLVSIDVREGKMPARMTTCHSFRVRGANAPFTTDITSGAAPWVVVPKHTHWGQGLASRDFETVLMLNNIAHRASARAENRGALTVYAPDGGERTVPVTVGAEGAAFVYLRDLLGPVGRGEAPVSFSWMLRMDAPGIDAFWAAFAPDGRICGDHAF